MTSLKTFAGHPVHSSLRSAQAALEAAVGAEGFGDDQDARDAAAEAGAILTRIESMLAVVEASSVPASLLDRLIAPTQALQASLVQSIPWTAATSATVGSTSSDLAVSASVLSPLLYVDPSRLAETTSAVAGAARNAAQDFETRVGALRDEIAVLSAKQQEAQASFDSAAASANAIYSERLAQIEQGLVTHSASVDGLVTAWKVTATQALDAQVAKQAEVLAAQRQEHESFVAGVAADAEKLKADFTKSSTAVVTELRAQRDEVGRLYKIITDTGTAGAFQKEADKQRDEADRFRWLGLGTILVAVIVAGLVLIGEPNLGFASPGFVAKLAIALALGATATYLVQQSGSHRRVERRYRALQLELVSLPPFVHDLQEKDRAELKREFVGRAFRGNDGTLELTGAETSPLGQEQLTFLGQVAEIVKKIR